MPIYKCKRIQPASLKSPALAGEFFTTKATWEDYICVYIYKAYFKVIFGKLKKIVIHLQV